MSSEAVTWVTHNSKHKGNARLVLIVIANYAHADGTNAFPSAATLASDANMSERQIRRIVDVLEASGELIVNQSEGRRASLYALNMNLAKGSKCPCCKRPNPDISDANPDISDTSTLTNHTANPDISRARSRKSLSENPETKTETLFGADAPEPKPKNASQPGKKIPPELEEVTAYFAENGSTPSQAKSFFCHYGSIGWVVGKSRTPMKSWHLSAVGWINRQPQYGGNQPSNTNGHTANGTPPAPKPPPQRQYTAPEGSPEWYLDYVTAGMIPAHRAKFGWHKDENGEWDEARWRREHE